MSSPGCSLHLPPAPQSASTPASCTYLDIVTACGLRRHPLAIVHLRHAIRLHAYIETEGDIDAVDFRSPLIPPRAKSALLLRLGLVLSVSGWVRRIHPLPLVQSMDDGFVLSIRTEIDAGHSACRSLYVVFPSLSCSTIADYTKSSCRPSRLYAVVLSANLATGQRPVSITGRSLSPSGLPKNSIHSS